MIVLLVLSHLPLIKSLFCPPIGVIPCATPPIRSTRPIPLDVFISFAPFTPPTRANRPVSVPNPARCAAPPLMPLGLTTAPDTSPP
jgi:hypothetical protein